jgi:hypothetical protein
LRWGEPGEQRLSEAPWTQLNETSTVEDSAIASAVAFTDVARSLFLSDQIAGVQAAFGEPPAQMGHQ